mmetsp:Transcript_9776/g.19618  ORF Transcript_9776/g.19618 Transcript_9776/m.19618 type:complete len:238 (+) Transcript_9776:540-1253(+)
MLTRTASGWISSASTVSDASFLLASASSWPSIAIMSSWAVGAAGKASAPAAAMRARNCSMSLEEPSMETQTLGLVPDSHWACASRICSGSGRYSRRELRTCPRRCLALPSKTICIRRSASFCAATCILRLDSSAIPRSCSSSQPAISSLSARKVATRSCRCCFSRTRRSLYSWYRASTLATSPGACVRSRSSTTFFFPFFAFFAPFPSPSPWSSSTRSRSSSVYLLLRLSWRAIRWS